MSKRLVRGNLGCNGKTSSWPLIGFPDGSINSIGSTVVASYVQRIGYQPDIIILCVWSHI